MANCKDCLHQCYIEATEEACNFFVDKTKYAEVVRCKDCKHYSKDGVWCDMNSKDRSEWFNWYEDDFCSYGERKDNERKAD